MYYFLLFKYLKIYIIINMPYNDSLLFEMITNISNCFYYSKYIDDTCLPITIEFYNTINAPIKNAIIPYNNSNNQITLSLQIFNNLEKNIGLYTIIYIILFARNIINYSPYLIININFNRNLH